MIYAPRMETGRLILRQPGAGVWWVRRRKRATAA